MSLRVQFRVGTAQKLTTLSYNDAGLTVSDGRLIPIRQVIAVRRDGRTLHVSYVGRNKKKGPMSLTHIVGTLEAEAEDAVLDAWIETLMHMAYQGIGAKRGRRLKVIINPYGGTKKGVAIFNKTVEPILRTAQCTLDVIHTTRGGHAYEIAKSTSLDYDAMVIVSGDGLIHEVLNGFAHHEQPIKAFRIPLAPIPTGTGNALSLNLLGMDERPFLQTKMQKELTGMQDGFDVSAAALNVVKGLPMNVDLFSLTQVCIIISFHVKPMDFKGGKRTISFMSQGMGLIADLDIGTEHLRWMGEIRFTVGLVKGLIQFKPCPVQLSYRAVDSETDKDKMYDMMQKRRGNDKKGDDAVLPQTSAETDDTSLPPLKYSFDRQKGAICSRDYMAFPVSLADDGLIDIVAHRVSSRANLLAGFGEAPKGVMYWDPSQSYIKAHAYRVKPLAPKGNFAVDGEIFPFEEFQVETHQGLGSVLSPYGYYAAEFARKSGSKA
ncbi:ATP-NAD kinase-like domain-containing protein [Roridomyces roridus]|uniref:ATP-NAD kinase-like domain-containing protein n=1 Tax=Roridomyces roridus TaxID=1738132 RepID=A0AAD7BWW5_9AGAR|nr:ATP-NAD kinase-like domain-containing protein [Roridomyces roridus]